MQGHRQIPPGGYGQKNMGGNYKAERGGWGRRASLGLSGVYGPAMTDLLTNHGNRNTN